MSARTYLGQGIKFPYVVNEKGQISLQNDTLLVQQSLIRIFQTEKNSVFMGEIFGCNFERFQFEQNDAILFSLLETEIADAIEFWEKRIDSFDIQFEKKSIELIHIMISYTISNVANIQSFVFPFYRQLIY